MEYAINQRVTELMENLEISRKNLFCEILGFSQDTFYTYFNDKKPKRVQLGLILAIAKKYEKLNLRWLLLGELPMWLEDDINTSIVSDIKPSYGNSKSIDNQNLSALMQKFSKGELAKMDTDDLLRLLALNIQELHTSFEHLKQDVEQLKKLEDTSKKVE